MARNPRWDLLEDALTASEMVCEKDVKSFRSHMYLRGDAEFVSVALSQTSAYAARPRVRG